MKSLPDQIAYEIYQVRQKKDVYKHPDWDWYMAELYLEVESGESVEEFIGHFI